MRDPRNAPPDRPLLFVDLSLLLRVFAVVKAVVRKRSCALLNTACGVSERSRTLPQHRLRCPQQSGDADASKTARMEPKSGYKSAEAGLFRKKPQ